jgi:hypothetical protein
LGVVEPPQDQPWGATTWPNMGGGLATPFLAKGQFSSFFLKKKILILIILIFFKKKK